MSCHEKRASDTSHRRALVVLKDVGIPILTVVLSGAISWFIAQGTVFSKTDEGRTMFNSVGYRYFAAMVGAWPEGKRNDDPLFWDAYEVVLSDIHEDMKWLRTNPYHAKLQRETDEIHYVQNRIAVEAKRVRLFCDDHAAPKACE